MTQSAYKPECYTSVSPYLVVSDAAATIKFLKEIFSASELRRFPGPDGRRIMHAELRIDDSIVMLGEAAEGWPATPSHVHVYVADVDAVFRSAIAAGARPLQEPVKKEDEDRRGGFLDAWGTSWWVATRVA